MLLPSGNIIRLNAIKSFCLCSLCSHPNVLTIPSPSWGIRFFFKYGSNLLLQNRYFPHAYFIPIVCVGNERRILIGPRGLAKAALVRNCLEIYWPCAGGLSAENAIGMQLRNPVNSGLTRWRKAVFKINKYRGGTRKEYVSKHGDAQADAERDYCRTRLARPNYQARTRTGEY